MDSSVALLQAASGLERLMYGAEKNPLLKDSTVAQISAALYYQANVVAKITNSKKFKDEFKKIIFTQIEKDFGAHIDAQARTKPKSFHHVYEWKKTGTKTGRLFKLTSIVGNDISFKIKYEFIPSKTMVPAPEGIRRHVFINKAAVMEAGMPLKIAPRHSKRLVFESNGITVFMPIGASVTVQRPGGPSVKNQFSLHYSRFFSGQLVNNSIKRSGFQRIFNSAMMKSMKLPSSIKKIQYSFSPNTIRTMADSAVASSFGGVIV